MKKLYVLYDAACGFCGECRRWFERQPKFIELEFVPQQWARLNHQFDDVKLGTTPEELVVVSDDGAVYRDTSAYLICLYALAEYRELSTRLARPALLPLARQAFHAVSSNRQTFSRWFRLASDEELSCELQKAREPIGCVLKELNRSGVRVSGTLSCNAGLTSSPVDNQVNYPPSGGARPTTDVIVGRVTDAAGIEGATKSPRGVTWPTTSGIAGGPATRDGEIRITQEAINKEPGRLFYSPDPETKGGGR